MKYHLYDEHERHQGTFESIEKNKIQLIINTTSGRKSIADSLSIRRTALSKKIPYFTTISAAKIAITGLNIVNNTEISVKSIQELYNI